MAKKNIRKMLQTILTIVVCLYVFVCALLYFFQEKLIFFPESLSADHRFSFKQPFEEIFIKRDDQATLHGLLFKADSAKGLIFYLHGNAGSVDSWGEVNTAYTKHGYDVFILDYRGYGKSTGKITGQQTFFEDVQTAYNELKKHYTEDKIIIIGYSVGTGAAAKLAADNHPKQLILQAPYYSFTDLVKHKVPIVPSFILKYRFPINEYIRSIQCPVTIFHGDADEVIYYGSSLKLQALFKPGDTLITLHNQSHNGITDNPEYQAMIDSIVAK